MAGALEGIKVLEFSEMIAAPFAGMHLGDMGADVIKVEPPEGTHGATGWSSRPTRARPSCPSTGTSGGSPST